jgi:hypothetical protein
MTAEQKTALEQKGLISPIDFVKLVAPDKPPQYAYQLLKQGLPHIMEVIEKRDKQNKLVSTKKRPMVDVAKATQWYNDSMEIKVPRKSKAANGGAPGRTSQDQNQNQKQQGGGLKKGQLLTYQRRPGLCTVAQIRSADPDIIYYSTVHGDSVHQDILEKYEYPFIPENLKKNILTRKILLDNPRRVIEYAINALRTLPVCEADKDLATEIENLMAIYPIPEKESAAGTNIGQAIDIYAPDGPDDDDDLIPQNETETSESNISHMMDAILEEEESEDDDA